MKLLKHSLFILLFCAPLAQANEALKQLKGSYSTPTQTLNTLIQAIIKSDMTLYLELLGRPLEEEELHRIESVKGNPGRKIAKIEPIYVEGREFVGKGANRMFCVKQKAMFTFNNQKKSKRMLKTCFKKKENRWFYLSRDVRLFQ